jgi:long-subunit fatty acid transport protein
MNIFTNPLKPFTYGESRHSLRFITLFFLVFITLLGCKEANKVKTKNFDIKDAEIQMNIPQSWEFEAIVGPTDSYTKYHGQFKRTDHGGFIDIETKLNQYYTPKITVNLLQVKRLWRTHTIYEVRKWIVQRP